MTAKPPLILIVEDEEVLRITFAEFLREEGHEVLTAENFTQALALLEEHPIDVVVSDIILGGRTGIDLLREIHQRGIPAKFITITGDPSLETATEAVRLGAFDYLPKPVNGNAIRRVVRLALERKAVEEERDRYRADLDTMFRAVGAGLLMVDKSLLLQRANDAAGEMLALQEEYRGASLRELHPEALAPLCEALEHTITTGAAVHDIRLQLHPTGGQARILMADTTILPGNSSAPGGGLVAFRDITRLVHLEEQVRRQGEHGRLVGRSRAMQEVYRFIDDLATADSTVLLIGESGTGKELIAQAIHDSSQRKSKPLIKVNCAALADDVLESELFGHVRGAFTGAVKDRVGRFEAAHGGTIFLDEIGDISARLQMRLLRVLQEGEFERVGESRSIKVDVRVVAATNQDLPEKIKQGSFRSDLYYRLNVIRVDIPALRQRKEDLPALVEHFIRAFNLRMDRAITGLSPEAMAAIVAHDWPGNVRELENAIERAFVVCRGSEILPQHLPPEITRAVHMAPMAEANLVEAPSASSAGREVVERVLNETDWNIAKTARRLGISRNTLYQRITHYGIKRPS